MEREDIAAVGQLLDKAFGVRNPIYSKWSRLIDWMYFSSAIKDQIPRAFVIADKNSIIGHIGLTLSEFTYGEQSFRIVHTGNWAIDPDHKAGMLSLRLIMKASSLGDAAIIIGGTDDAQHIFPKVGFKKQLNMDRFIKVIRPMEYIHLSMSHSHRQLVRNIGKMTMSLINSPLSPFMVKGKRPRSVYQMKESNGQDAPNVPGSDLDAVSPPRRVLRNKLNADYMNWYRQCPQEEVHILKFYSGDKKLVGQVTTGILSRSGCRYANLVNVDTFVDDPSAWSDILDGTERFLRDKGVSHINTLATYEPFCTALREKGYCRVNRLPLWVYDKDNNLAGIEAWHITFIEGDLSFAFE
jgi:hypothetical protein